MFLFPALEVDFIQISLIAEKLKSGENLALVSDAGHNPPVLKRAGGQACLLELPKGFPLGVVDEGEFQDAEFVLGPGDTLLFYTDGVTDAADDSGATFGTDRLLATVSSAAPGAKSVVDAVLAATGDFVGLSRPFDDLTMIAVSSK